MTQAAAAWVFGVSRWSVVQWVHAHRSDGPQALLAKPRGRRVGEAGKLTVTQAKRIRALVVGKMPEQLKLPFCLWTRAAVQRLIGREYRVRLSLSAIGGYLQRWGLPAQRPIKRAYERTTRSISATYRQRESSSTFTLAMNVDYLREVFAGDEVRITSRMLDYDHKRIHYFHQMYHAGEG